MRIAVTHPTNWPHVRRGTERFMNELAEFLAHRGHSVTVVSAKPGRGSSHREFGYTTKNYRRLWHPALGAVGVLEAHAFLATCLAELLRCRYDLVHCCSFTDAYAASLARRATGAPYVFWVNGLPPRVKYYRSLSLGGRVFRAAVRRADEVVNISDFTQEYVERNYGRSGIVVPVPVRLDRFPLCRGRDLARPEILCTASLDDARKGGRVLMRAFNVLKTKRPAARLRIAYSLRQSLREEFLSLVAPQWRGDVEFCGAGRLEDLPTWYGRAAASVLPSLWEPFGLVVVESLSAGTPAVGARSGALPSILTDPDVGRLFDPGDDSGVEPSNAEGLAQAIDEAIELSADPETPDRCRRAAERYSWENVGPRFEEIYEGVVGRRGGCVERDGAS